MALASEEGETLWSPISYRLKDITDRIPTLVRVAEGIYGSNEATSFSQGDLIRLDTCGPLERVNAYLTQPGRNTRYEKYGDIISLPYNYKGHVRVQPIHGVNYIYKSVEELIAYFPRYVRVKNKIIFDDPVGCSRTIEPGVVIKLKAVRRGKTGGLNSVRCELNGEDVILPKTLTGTFQVLPDDGAQTIRDVVETYKLPQCVRFLDSGVKQMMSKDLQEAIDNMKTYRGEILLTSKVTSGPVLFGHYKGTESGSPTQMCRRTAVVIPLDAPDIKDLEVQLPKRKNTNAYEEFLVKVFPATENKSSILEDALYVDFATVSNVHFLSRSDPPAVPLKPEPDPESFEPPPPIPPRQVPAEKKNSNPNENRPLPAIKEQPVRKEELKASTLGGRGPTYVSLSHDNRPRNIVAPFCQVLSSTSPSPSTANKSSAPLIRRPTSYCGPPTSLLGDAFSQGMTSKGQEDKCQMSSDDETEIYEDISRLQPNLGASIDVKKYTHKVKRAITNIVGRVRPDKRRTSLSVEETDEIEDDDETYDHIQTCARDISELSIVELHSVLTECGMEELAKTCRQERVDGSLFSNFSSNILKKKPFFLSDWKITKVKEIQKGWLPKL